MTRSAILFTSGCVITLSAVLVFACSPDPGPFFTPSSFPEDQAVFNGGRLGLLTPALSKQNELLAFRILSGFKVAAPSEHQQQNGVQENGPQAWTAARQMFVDAPFPSNFFTYRMSRSQPLVSYDNCLDDAFFTAARTLKDRRQQYPPGPAFTAWVTAQDQVFDDCNSTASVYPANPEANAPALVRADREYQIAAAHFYSEDFDEAERRFRAIAADSKSPWQHLGTYMVGRTLLRKASLQRNGAAAAAARQQFITVAKDSGAGNLAQSAQGLLQHLDAIEHPAIVMASLSKRLLMAHPAEQAFDDDLAQSVYILKADPFIKAMSEPGLPDAFDWVHTLENGTGEHALERWTATRSLPWLTASLIYANGKDPAAIELTEQADRLKPDSPAFGTAQYNAVRLRIERGETEAARTQVDGLLSTAKDQPDSLVNAWRAERMRVSTSFDDLLRWAARKPVNGREYVEVADPASPVFDADAAGVLNFKTLLGKLATAAHSTILPAWSASDIALAAWTRAFLLNDADVARAVGPIVAKDHPDWASRLVPPVGTETAEWRFRAALLIAQHHEFEPMVRVDYRKHAWPESWWCAVPDPPGQGNNMSNPEVAWKLPAFFALPEGVLSKEERNAAQVEIAKLGPMGSAQQFLAPIIMNWANGHPQDALVPESLHRLVVVVRYGCHMTGKSGDQSDGRISKQAFDLLHTRYPNSEWAKQTPYWFDQ